MSTVEDSKEKILRDWNKPDKNGKFVGGKFSSFEKLYRYLIHMAKLQGSGNRFSFHPYDNFAEYRDKVSKYKDEMIKNSWKEINNEDKLKEKIRVTKRLTFLKRIKDYKKSYKRENLSK